MKSNRGRWKVAFRSQKLITGVLEGAGSGGRPDLAGSLRSRSEGFDAAQTSKEPHKVMRSLFGTILNVTKRGEARSRVCSPWSSGLVSGLGQSVEGTWHEEGVGTLSHVSTGNSSNCAQRQGNTCGRYHGG